MDLVVKARGGRITKSVRTVVEHKLSRLERMEPKVTRVEVEVIHEKNPRLGGAHHVEAALGTPRKTFRATADVKDVGAALDVLVDKLERQIRDHHTKRRTRRIAGASRVKSAQAGPVKAGPGEMSVSRASEGS